MNGTINELKQGLLKCANRIEGLKTDLEYARQNAEDFIKGEKK